MTVSIRGESKQPDEDRPIRPKIENKTDCKERKSKKQKQKKNRRRNQYKGLEELWLETITTRKSLLVTNSWWSERSARRVLAEMIIASSGYQNFISRNSTACK